MDDLDNALKGVILTITLFVGMFLHWYLAKDNMYAEGVKDCLSGKAKYEIKQDTLISR